MATQPFDHKKNAGLGIKITQIIKFAVCVDNKDPQRAGRIRAVMTKGEGLTKSKISDPLNAIIGFDSQAVKEKTYSFGVQNKHLPDFAPNGIPLPEGKGCFPNPDDVALLGRENCDIVLGMREKSIVDETDDKLKDWYPQILIRSGQLIKNDKFSSRPRFNPKNTFPTTLTTTSIESEKTVVEDVPLVTLIEYHLDEVSLQAGIFTGFMRILKVPLDSNSKIYMSGDFTKEIQLPPNTVEACRISFTSAPSVSELGGLLTQYLSEYDSGEWSNFIKPPPSWAVKTYHPQVDLSNNNNVGSFLGKTHPFYFRPDSVTLRFMDKAIPVGAPVVWPTMQTMAASLKDLVVMDGVGTDGWGLAFTSDVGERKVKENKVKEIRDEITSQDIQQGIISAGAEKIYLLSHNSSELNGRITLNTNYGIDQEKFVVDIDGKTNSLVRGEKLLELLTKIVNFVSSHTHAFPGLAPVPQGHDGTRVEDISRLLLDAPNTILNQNIRIN